MEKSSATTPLLPVGHGIQDGALIQVASNKNGISLWLLKDVFYPGETIHGKMKATFTSQISVRAIKIKLTSRAKVFWWISTGTQMVPICASLNLAPTIESSLQEMIPIRTNFVLEPGQQYEWPVELMLPQSLPSSFSFKKGTNEMRLPVELSTCGPISSCYCFLGKGEATLHLVVPVSCLPFADGISVSPDSFPISVGVENLSGTAVTNVRLALIGEILLSNRLEESRCTIRDRCSFTVVDHLIAPKILPGTTFPLQAVSTFPTLQLKWDSEIDVASSRFFTPKNLHTVQMPTLAAGNLIKITYRLELTAKGGRCKSLKLVTPIIFAPTNSSPQLDNATSPLRSPYTGDGPST
ncbi:hypothetical protein NSK_001804 [Nannochloropsis salina CCMP1776]|uniref:Arrestin-like N-terminal domain-containing protein n=1 Tax=Nannochloropsis salina CCMP1776 TaxID=1027361 RepID=A0A4D9D5R2_9STRA|nr:hypothetical protein NSK_001804 [Nannochloropsis salina CCMP1776]|eukprot:TFJ86716.1 hypothetical protein NSK_001804 [Nannochloropsis salina CCMP1776]